MNDFRGIHLDPTVDKVDGNILNLAYNDQQIDFDDEIDVSNGNSNKCCDGIYTGTWLDEDYQQIS